MIHLYYGDGKGKTTAAMGLALRALGRGKRVVIAQFLKNGESGEIGPLIRLGAVALAANPVNKFVFQMNDEEKEKTAAACRDLILQVKKQACDLVILDELCAARKLGMVPEDLAKSAVLGLAAGCEVVITGRGPEPWMTEAAEYLTEMCCRRHPYSRGVAAREGIEF